MIDLKDRTTVLLPEEVERERGQQFSTIESD